MKDNKIQVLLEMRPALQGFEGVPQEVRMLFRGLRKLPSVNVEGLIQSDNKNLAPGTRDSKLPWRKLSPAKRINRFSQVVVSITEKPYRTIIDDAIYYVYRAIASFLLLVRTFFSFDLIKLTKFDPFSFEDFVWRNMFARTLLATDLQLVTTAQYRVCTVPWDTLHSVGLGSLNFRNTPIYPRLGTRGFDIFISQTPYPGRVTKGTRFVVRYHDAIPVFMPHTIPNTARHQAIHFYALLDNVRSGAYFSCVSDATRNELLKMFPDLGDRAVTIHNMVSEHYFNEDSSFERVVGAIRSRLNLGNPEKGVDLIPKFFSNREKEAFYTRALGKRPFPYLLMVSSIEPRKNHTRLLAAWEFIKAEIDPNLKLVVVGVLGWDYLPIVNEFRSWIDRGEVFMLARVPAPELRVLYHHAMATICPSLGEGFDFSGVEGMRSGGVVIASDIPVHREVYGDAAEFFNPYSTRSLVEAIQKVLYSPESTRNQEQLRIRGANVASRYVPEKILPMWDTFLRRVSETTTP